MAVAATSGFRKCGRPWRPRKTSDKLLVTDIVASIRAHAEAGMVRTASDYTSHPDLIEAVEAVLRQV